MTKFQLHNVVKALLAASRRQTNLAEPGSELFDIHMTASVILAELAYVAHDIYCATHTNEGEERDTQDQEEYTDNETT